MSEDDARWQAKWDHSHHYKDYDSYDRCGDEAQEAYAREWDRSEREEELRQEEEREWEREREREEELRQEEEREWERKQEQREWERQQQWEYEHRCHKCNGEGKV